MPKVIKEEKGRCCSPYITSSNMSNVPSHLNETGMFPTFHLDGESSCLCREAEGAQIENTSLFPDSSDPPSQLAFPPAPPTLLRNYVQTIYQNQTPVVAISAKWANLGFMEEIKRLRNYTWAREIRLPNWSQRFCSHFTCWEKKKNDV